MPINILTKITTKFEDFSKGQKAIAQYILEHYEKASYMTAQKLGVAANVSESTVVRFAYEMGYDGFPELQQDMCEMLKNKLTSIQRIEVADDLMGDGDVLTKVLNIDISKIKKTIEETSKEAFNGAVEAIVKAKTIYILGSRSASILAGFLALYFNIMFESVRLIDTTSTSEMFEQIMRINENDIMIAISFPRYSKKTVKAMDFAKNVDAKIIGISDSEMSPLAERSNFFLQAESDIASFVDSLVAPLSLINALIVAVGLRKKDSLKQTYAHLENIWDEYDVYI